jgi:hypothetical protein
MHGVRTLICLLSLLGGSIHEGSQRHQDGEQSNRFPKVPHRSRCFCKDTHATGCLFLSSSRRFAPRRKGLDCPAHSYPRFKKQRASTVGILQRGVRGQVDRPYRPSPTHFIHAFLTFSRIPLSTTQKAAGKGRWGGKERVERARERQRDLAVGTNGEQLSHPSSQIYVTPDNRCKAIL